MKILRTIISAFLTIIISLSTVAITFIISFNTTIFNPIYIKDTLQTTNSYTLIFNQIPSIISTFMKGNISSYSTSVSRFIINNLSKNAFKSPSDSFINDFFSYLNGYKNIPSVDISHFKVEIKLLSDNKHFDNMIQNKISIESYLHNLPDKLKLEGITDSQILLRYAKTYYYFKSAPIILIVLIAICIIMLLIANKKSLRKFFLTISLSLLSSSFILFLSFLNKKYIYSSMIKYLFANSTPEFKLLSASLHPMLLFTLSTISSFILKYSLIICVIGLLIIILIQKPILKLFTNFSTGLVRCFKNTSTPTITNFIFQPKKKEPRKTQITLKIIKNKSYYRYF